jgi:hypothetical protein
VNAFTVSDGDIYYQPKGNIYINNNYYILIIIYIIGAQQGNQHCISGNYLHGPRFVYIFRNVIPYEYLKGNL